MSETHDFYPCESNECRYLDEHCGYSWCGAPRNHPSHTCFQEDPNLLAERKAKEKA